MALPDVRPLQEGLPFGVRIGGITPALLDDETVRDEINSLFDRQGIIVFADVEPTNEMQLKLSTVFGSLKEHPIPSLARVDADGMPGVIEIRPKDMPPGFEEQARSMPRAIHPAVWTRSTGEKVLHVSSYMAQGIVGEENAEGDALFEEICQTINRLGRERGYHHRWKPDEMLIWDNWRMLHSVSGNRPEEERVMQRTTIKGDYGLGRFEGGGTGGTIPDAMMAD